MASVSYRKVGKKWHIRFREHGRKEIVKSYPTSIHEDTIEKKANWFDEEIALGRYDPWEEEDADSDYPLGKAIEKFIKENMDAGQWLPRTKQTYQERLGLITREFGAGASIKRLSENKLQRWLDEYPVSATSKKNYRVSVNVFLKWLHENDYTKKRWKLTLSRLDKIEIRNKSGIKHITYKQLQDICKAYRWRVRMDKRIGYMKGGFDEDRLPDAWWFMFWQMLRKSELPKIRGKDVNGGKLRVHGKGNKIQWMDMVPPAREIVDRRKGDPDKPLFGIKPTNHNFLYESFRDAVRLALGEDHRSGLHQLRHGGAVHYFTLGKPVQFVSKLLRHADVAVTYKVYGGVIEDKISSVFSDVKDEPAH